MTERDRPETPEERFAILTQEIVTQLKKTSPSNETNVYTGIVANDAPGGVRALSLTSKGEWIWQVQMMGGSLAPNINNVLSAYADVINDDYSGLINGPNLGKEKRENYITENKEKLLDGLNKQMETVLGMLQKHN